MDASMSLLLSVIAGKNWKYRTVTIWHFRLQQCAQISVVFMKPSHAESKAEVLQNNLWECFICGDFISSDVTAVAQNSYALGLVLYTVSLKFSFSVKNMPKFSCIWIFTVNCVFSLVRDFVSWNSICNSLLYTEFYPESLEISYNLFATVTWELLDL